MSINIIIQFKVCWQKNSSFGFLGRLLGAAKTKSAICAWALFSMPHNG
jgi:hypothetical protein